MAGGTAAADGTTWTDETMQARPILEQLREQLHLRLRLPEFAKRLLDDAAMCPAAGGPTEQTAVLGWLAFAVVGAVGGFVVGGPVLALAGAVLGAGLPLAYLRLRRGERDRRLAQVLPDFLESLARSLRSGASLSTATVEAINGPPSLAWPLAEELSLIKGELSGGASFRQTIAAWQHRRPLRPVTLTAAALMLGAGVGGQKARSVDAVAQTLREQNAIQQELASSSAQARMSAIVIVALPVAFLFLTTAVGADGQNLLWGSPFGLVCLGAGVALNLVGGFWMRRILRGVPI